MLRDTEHNIPFRTGDSITIGTPGWPTKLHGTIIGFYVDTFRNHTYGQVFVIVELERPEELNGIYISRIVVAQDNIEF